MGWLKDALFFEVWQFLLKRPGARALLSSLNHPQGGQTQIRDAWKALQAEGKDEGMKKGTGLKQVLAEREDIFSFDPNETGHPYIALTPSARVADAAAGLPARGTLPNPPPMTAGVAAGAEDAAAALVGQAEEQLWNDGAGVSAEELAAIEAALMEGTSPEEAAVMMAHAQAVNKRGLPEGEGPAKKKKKSAGMTTSQALEMPGIRGYRDLIWTPAIAAAKAKEEAGELELKQALIEALHSYNGQTVALSVLGFDFKVAQLRKTHKEKLLEMVTRYEDVFELVPDSIKKGYNVNFQPGFDVDGAIRGSEASLLPRRIDDPRNVSEKMQALRIDIIYALHRRGGRSTVAEIGQEPQVQRRKQTLGQAKKLQDFIQIFKNNFQVKPDPQGVTQVDLMSLETSDQSMIDDAIQKSRTDALTRGPRPWERGGKGGKSFAPQAQAGLPMLMHQPVLPFMPTGMAMPGMPMGFSSAPPMAMPAYGSAFAAPIQQPVVQQPVAYGYPGYPPQPGYPPAPAGFSYG